MLRSLRISLSLTGAAAFALASSPVQPVAAQEEGSAADLGVMEINLKDAVRFNWGFQGALQGAGTPNQAGIGAFLPIAIGENSVFFLDALANANFGDRNGESSIVNTFVAGTTISTSTRLGYRWLNGDRSWMYGINAGYDSRPMNTGEIKHNVPLFGSESSVFFQQVAGGLEAVSDQWNINAYAAVPIGETIQRLNWLAIGGAVDTYGIDVGYFISPELKAWAGYYYQSGDEGLADGSGVNGGLEYNIANGLTLTAKASYDHAYDTRILGGIKYRFDGNGTTARQKVGLGKYPLLGALNSSPAHRDVRVMDCYSWDEFACEAYDDVTNWLGKSITDGLKTAAIVEIIRKVYKRIRPGNTQEFADKVLGEAADDDWEEVYYSCIDDPEALAAILALDGE